MQAKELLTQSYDFTLPQELIATHPASPRDHARLLVYDRATDTITHTYFYEFEKFIPKNAALIFNNTKVIKARLYGHKQSGGKIELLINRALNAYDVSVYIRGKIKVGSLLFFDKTLQAQVVELKEDGSRIVNFYHNEELLRFEELLPIIDTIGHIPLPPYIQREDNEKDANEYQSVFAKEEGAVAAPTASLHFTPEQHQRICQNYQHAFVTLHIGSGTFKPVDAEVITEHPMHSEYYDISPEAKTILDNPDIPVLSVGTTSTRTIEYYDKHGKEIQGEANLFLHPHNKPSRVNHILTNFHLPKSTLVMLVASFVGLEKTHELYAEAIKEKYRFYSYGDAMLIL
ncbi:MAG: tRNA preQ1(34) S-adenosylmethionine ribosyltransferase-isomerase QueA [Campylobacterales bacterium]|nr:tRNA preQ1(34) S-adenosylmethionine ribosyltransferase-isomerase QueA [Campylobacterales bacterium]